MAEYRELLATQGLCSPMRGPFYTALRSYVTINQIQAWGEYYASDGGTVIAFVPDTDIWAHRHVCRVILTAAQARWCEFLIWSTGRWPVVSRPYDLRNQAWGERRQGVMPFHDGIFPTWEAGCKEPLLLDPKLIAQRVAYVNSPHFDSS